MVKGCRRDSILLRGNAGEFFEEAYFIVRRDLPDGIKITERDMVREARRIVGEQMSPRYAPPPRRLNVRQALTCFFCGCALGSFLVVALVILGVLP